MPLRHRLRRHHHALHVTVHGPLRRRRVVALFHAGRRWALGALLFVPPRRLETLLPCLAVERACRGDRVGEGVESMATV